MIRKEPNSVRRHKTKTREPPVKDQSRFEKRTRRFGPDVVDRFKLSFTARSFINFQKRLPRKISRQAIGWSRVLISFGGPSLARPHRRKTSKCPTSRSQLQRACRPKTALSRRPCVRWEASTCPLVSRIIGPLTLKIILGLHVQTIRPRLRQRECTAIARRDRLDVGTCKYL